MLFMMDELILASPLRIKLVLIKPNDTVFS